MDIESPSGAWVPESCTLPTAEQPLRVAEFDDLLSSVVGLPRRVAPGRLEVVLPEELTATARDLVARETACCSFFTFTLKPCAEGIELIAEVPAAHVAVLDGMERRIDRSADQLTPRLADRPAGTRPGPSSARSSS